MKTVLIRNARVVDPRSPHHGETVDILVKGNRIADAGQNLEANDAEIADFRNLHVSPGWVDMRVNIPDPGHEYREDLLSAVRAAADGGITSMCVTATAEPARDSKAAIEYVRNRTRDLAVKVYPYGTLSVNRAGKDLSEMYDMFLAGAVAFGDDKRPVADTGLLSRALMYAKTFNGLVISFPYDQSLSPSGKINEGIPSTRLGLKGIPAVAEEMAVARDLRLLGYTGGRLHFATISTPAAARLIREARKEGLEVTAEVSAAHLLLEDELLDGFDTNLKLMPPLRGRADREELIRGLSEGSIDVICSDHTPLETEEKDKEFDLASFGATGLQTLFSASRAATHGRLSLEQLITAISIRPAEILNIPCPVISKGEEANLTLFDPDHEFVLDPAILSSRSKNTPFAGRRLKGVPLAIINNNNYYRTNYLKSFS